MTACSSTKNNSASGIEKGEIEQQFENTAERDAKLIRNGIDFYASGSEPDWTLIIDFDKSTATLHILGEYNRQFKIVENKDNIIDNLIFELEDNSLRMETVEEGCNNTMSGEGFPNVVNIELNGKAYIGCGKYLGEAVGVNTLDLRIFNKWFLSDLNGVEFNKENIPYFSINKKTKQTGGYASCNNFSGNCYLAGNSIKFGPFMMTKRYCGYDSVEQKFMSALEQANSYYISDDKLVLLDGSKKELMSLVSKEK